MYCALFLCPLDVRQDTKCYTNHCLLDQYCPKPCITLIHFSHTLCLRLVRNDLPNYCPHRVIAFTQFSTCRHIPNLCTPMPNHLFRIGEADNPGPDTRLTSQNTTSVPASQGHLANIPAHIQLWQETKAPPGTRSGLVEHFKDHGWRIDLSVMNKEKKRGSGGLGIAARCPNSLATLKPLESKLQEAIDNGRCSIYAIQLCAGDAILCHNTYGWCSSDGPLAITETNEMCRCIANDARCRGNFPMALCGDLNAEIAQLPVVKAFIREFAWPDLGANAHWWGGTPYTLPA